jgi:hypothetical protein
LYTKKHFWQQVLIALFRKSAMVNPFSIGFDSTLYEKRYCRSFLKIKKKYKTWSIIFSYITGA